MEAVPPATQVRNIVQLLHAPSDEDYVESFQLLSRVNVELKQNGTNSELLLRKAILEAHVGNYVASAECARRATLLAPENEEAHYQKGTSFLLMALVRADAVEGGLGMRDAPDKGVRELLQDARDAFSRCIELNHDDPEVEEAHQVLADILKITDDEAEMRRLLRGE